VVEKEAGDYDNVIVSCCCLYVLPDLSLLQMMRWRRKRQLAARKTFVEHDSAVACHTSLFLLQLMQRVSTMDWMLISVRDLVMALNGSEE